MVNVGIVAMHSVLFNCLTVIVGSLVGYFFSHKITDEFSKVVKVGAGLISIILGIQMAVKYENIIFFSLSLIIGGLWGSLIDIDGKILGFGNFLERLFMRRNKAVVLNTEITSDSKNNHTDDKSTVSKKQSQNFAYGFFNASILYCVGAMTIIGSFKAGLENDHTIIYTKAVLDGFMAIVFTASFGIGTAFSALSIFVYQGLLTISAKFLAPWVTPSLMNEISGLGGAMIILIGFNLLEIKQIKVANFLPSLVLAVLFVLLKEPVLNLF